MLTCLHLSEYSLYKEIGRLKTARGFELFLDFFLYSINYLSLILWGFRVTKENTSIETSLTKEIVFALIVGLLRYLFVL